MLYAINRKDGGVSVMTVIGDVSAEKEMAKWHPDIVAEHDVKSARAIDSDEIPSDRTFREAWKPDLSIDMVKAKDIQRGRLRIARAPLLEDLDLQYMRADETGDTKTKAAIAKQKQALRDVTTHPDIEAAKTPEALKAVWPEILSAARIS